MDQRESARRDRNPRGGPPDWHDRDGAPDARLGSTRAGVRQPGAWLSTIARGAGAAGKSRADHAGPAEGHREFERGAVGGSLDRWTTGWGHTDRKSGGHDRSARSRFPAP